MKYVKKFERFISEKLVMGSPETAPVETPTETPTRPRPTRPGIVPIGVPSEQDAPLAGSPETAPVETPTETPTRPRPTRPGIVPTEVPSEQDAPLASAKKVIDRFSSAYFDASEEDRKDIDSYFEQK